MKVSTAAILEPNDTRWKSIAAGLKKAGLTVSAAREVDALKREHLVVLGTSAGAGSSKLARAARAKLPNALVFAAQSKGFKAAYADAVLPLPVSANDLKVRLAERTAKPAQATVVQRPGDGILDPTTSFYTFSHFKEVVFVEVKRARRYGFPLALALVAFDPVDGKMTPELHAQLMGGLALAMRRSMRDTDYPVAYSPDRILLLMPHTDLAGSLIVARRLNERVARATLQLEDISIRPTISVGVAAGEPGRDYAFSDLVRQAQDGLAEAIERGGNRIEFTDSLDERNTFHSSDSGIPHIPPAVLPPPLA